MTRKRLLNRTALVSLVSGLLMTGLPTPTLAQPTSSPASQEMPEPTLVDQAIKHQTPTQGDATACRCLDTSTGAS